MKYERSQTGGQTYSDTSPYGECSLQRMTEKLKKKQRKNLKIGIIKMLTDSQSVWLPSKAFSIGSGID